MKGVVERKVERKLKRENDRKVKLEMMRNYFQKKK